MTLEIEIEIDDDACSDTDKLVYQQTNTHTIKCSYTIVTTSLFLVLSVAQLTIGATNQSQCKSFILPHNWLIVDASIYLCFCIPCFIIMYLKRTGNKTNKCIYPMLIITSLFFFVYNLWNVIGSIMFWRDCSNIKSQSLNAIMNTTLISQYVALFVLIGLLYIDC
jgi:hypothetical protein